MIPHSKPMLGEGEGYAALYVSRSGWVAEDNEISFGESLSSAVDRIRAYEPSHPAFSYMKEYGTSLRSSLLQIPGFPKT